MPYGSPIHINTAANEAVTVALAALAIRLEGSKSVEEFLRQKAKEHIDRLNIVDHERPQFLAAALALLDEASA